jgi:CheY-like chemotaxis protein
LPHYRLANAGLNGLELQRHLNAVAREIPIIFVTAYSQETRQQALNAGAVAFLTKPFEEATLVAGDRIETCSG